MNFGPLVGTDWLRASMGRVELAVVDMRDEDAYAAGRVPGAVRLDLADLGKSVVGQDNVLLAAPEFERLISSLGISNRHTVVVYDDQWGLAAARLLWALHAYGHPRVAVLDGGWDQWSAEGGPVEAGQATASSPASSSSAAAGSPAASPPAVTTADFRAVVDPAVAADLPWMRERVARGGAVLLDTRTPAEYQHGHLPGALSWDWFNAVPPDSWSCARDPVELLEEWKALGLEPTQEVAVYCRSGMRAAHTYMALRHAGFPRVRLYDGSWQEWAMHMEEEPVAKGRRSE